MTRIVLMFVLFFVTVSSVSAQTFRFTAIPDQDTHRLQQRFSKVADYLSEQLEVEVEYVPVKSYSASVAVFKNDQVQLAWFGGLSGVRARLGAPGSQAIAQGVEDPHFTTYFIVNTATGIEKSEGFPEAIKDLTFTFGSKGSTSGRLMPEFHIRKFFKQPPNRVFKRVGFSGDHSKTIALVQSGAWQAGAVNFKVWERELADGKIDPEKVRVVWKTPGYPDYNWTLRGDVDKKFGEGFAKKVQEALLKMNQPELLQSFPRKAFIAAKNEDYAPILHTAREIGLIGR